MSVGRMRGGGGGRDGKEEEEVQTGDEVARIIIEEETQDEADQRGQQQYEDGRVFERIEEDDEDVLRGRAGDFVDAKAVTPRVAQTWRAEKRWQGNQRSHLSCECREREGKRRGGGGEGVEKRRTWQFDQRDALFPMH